MSTSQTLSDIYYNAAAAASECSYLLHELVAFTPDSYGVPQSAALEAMVTSASVSLLHTLHVVASEHRL